MRRFFTLWVLASGFGAWTFHRMMRQEAEARLEADAAAELRWLQARTWDQWEMDRMADAFARLESIDREAE